MPTLSNNDLTLTIKAVDQASAVLKRVMGTIDDTTSTTQRQATVLNTLQKHWVSYAALAAGAGVATNSLVGFMESSISAANRLQGALTGLTSVSNAFGQSADSSRKAAQDLASDGLMTVTDAATGLKNLLASGFSLDQAVTLMKRFKDSAAFGRQSALSFGQAISSATEGIKNGNSILVDNAGVTKNLSVMLTEAGFSSQDLMHATSDASIRQAIFNGILKETNAQAGDAAKLADSAAGKQAVWAAQTEVLQQQIGMALQPALLALLQTVTPIIEQMAGWVSLNPELASGLIIGTTAVMGLTTVVGTMALAVAGLGPVFALMKVAALGSIGAVSTGFTAMSVLVASPLVMPALAVAAALASIAAVWAAYNDMKAAVEGAVSAQESLQASNDATVNRYKQVMADPNSSPELKARWQGVMKNLRYASGTSYAPGGWATVGERGQEMINLPRGSQVLTANQTRDVRQSNGTSGSVVIQNMNVYNDADEDRMLRKIALRLGR